MAALTIKKSDNKKEFSVRIGNEISLRLEENATTGYQWEITRIDYKMVEIEESSFSIEEGAEIGAGGIRLIRFRPIKQGKTHLSLKLWQSWEGESSVSDWFEFVLRIKP